MERLNDAAARQDASQVLADAIADPLVAAFLRSALGDCPFLLDLACKDITRLAAILDSDPQVRMEAIVADLAAADWPARAEAMAALRRARQEVALTLGLADLAGAVDLETVTTRLSDFADAALAAALRFALAEAARSGKWIGQGTDIAHGFFLLGMGKYGADELNYSSDIDLIALFEPGAPGLAEDVEPSDFWVRIVRLLVTLLQERTADGYVFRTDLRLRPDPGATRVAISAPAALLYYEGMGQNWERAALIKARNVAGDRDAGDAFLRELSPFIWRRHLDFAAIADIHSIKRQVQSHRGHASVRVLGHDIKRGRGGIREIEFFAQTQQLIAGGRDAALRGRQTRAMLQMLAAKGWIDEPARRELDDAYVVLRQVEHRLQMVRDEQTHTLPDTEEELARIGRLMGYADATAFESDLRGILETVAKRYSELFEGTPDLSVGSGNLVFTGDDDDPDTLETLSRLGFQDPAQVIALVRGWHYGRVAAMRSAAARESLTEITPALLEALSRAGNPDAAVRAFDSLLKALPAGAQLFARLRNNPDLLTLLATVLSAAPRLAEAFAHRPHIADALLDPSAAGHAASRTELEAGLAASLAEAKSYEEVLDRARRFASERRFLISVGLLNGTLTPPQAGRAFSDLAEAIVRALLDQTAAAFAEQHGHVPGGRNTILAFGRLGSREMTAGSDLDLIVIYDHDADAAGSNGRKSLSPSHYYIRLTQRLVAALTAPTAEGIAYAVDLRLRPSGQAGPLATHVEAFERYQMDDAWTWEHMAMSRGRAVAGDPELAARVDAALDAIVAKPRQRATLAADVAAMRQRIARDKAAAGSFDVKLAPGGLIDCEFAAQFMVLSGLGRVPGETTLETLRRGATEGRLDGGAVLVASAALQSAILQLERVANTGAAEDAPEALKRLMVAIAETSLHAFEADAPVAVGSFAELEKQLQRMQEKTRKALEALLGTAIG